MDGRWRCHEFGKNELSGIPMTEPMESKLLRVELPYLSLTPHEPIEDFFDKCEVIADEMGWTVDRRRDYAGPKSGSDQLNLYLGPNSRDVPMLRMVCPPNCKGRLSVDIVAPWSSSSPTYEEYLGTAKTEYKNLFDEFKARHGRRLRLGVPNTPTFFDPGGIDCNTVSYARGKFDSAIDLLATGEGDARARLVSVHRTIYVVRPADLPAPLDQHLEWIYEQLTKKPARHRWEGSVEASLSAVRNSTASKIAKRVMEIANALREIDRKLCDGWEYFD